MSTQEFRRHMSVAKAADDLNITESALVSSAAIVFCCQWSR